MKYTQKAYRSLHRIRRWLRFNMTTPEILLWNKIKSRQFQSLKFRRQHGIGPYIVDFFCPEKRIVIEIDGETHTTNEQKDRDRNRDEYIQSLGVRTFRYTNREITDNLNGVLEDIAIKLRT